MDLGVGRALATAVRNFGSEALGGEAAGRLREVVRRACASLGLGGREKGKFYELDDPGEDPVAHLLRDRRFMPLDPKVLSRGR